MKLIIFRHGQTDANKMKVLQGSVDTPINETGIVQAKELGEKLANRRLRLIYSSPKKRTLQTAEYVAAPNDSEIVIIEDLREIDLGPYENMAQSALLEKYQNLRKDGIEGRVPTLIFDGLEGVESHWDMIKRWENALEIIKNDRSYGEVGVATHGGMMAVIWYWKYGEMKLHFDNCEYFEIDVAGPNDDGIL